MNYKINKYYYNEELDLTLRDELDELDENSFEDYEDGYNRKTGEYHWTEMSHYTIPLKTNYFVEWISDEERIDLYE